MPLPVGGVQDQVLVDLVGHGDHVVLAAQLGEQLQLGARQHGAGRVVRGVEQQQPGPRAERRAQLGLLEAEPPVRAGAQRHRAHDGAGQRDRRGVGVVQRVQDDHLVTGLAQRQHRGGDGLGGPGGHHDLGRRVVGEPVEPLLVRGDGLAQLRRARTGRVLVDAVTDGLRGGL